MNAPVFSQRGDDSKPARLRSQWEIVEPFAQAIVFLNEIMDIAEELAAKPGMAWVHRRIFPRHHGGEFRTKLDGFLRGLEMHFAAADLDACVSTVKKMRDCSSRPGFRLAELDAYSRELKDRLLDQMKGRTFFSLTMKEVEYYSMPFKGWEAIVSKFPAATMDIEEARKCWLSRYAASVFHSLRVVECGLIVLGELVGVTDPGSWTSTTNCLRNIIKKEHADKHSIRAGKLSLFQQMHRSIGDLKMHGGIR